MITTTPDIQRAAEFVSLALTAPTVVTAVGVVLLWGRAAVQAFRDGELTAHQWFLVGVAVGFAGSVLDNVYWSIPWFSSYLDLAATPDLMAAGVYFNIFNRQLIGIGAAYCHLRAARASETSKARAVNHVIAASWLGLALAVALLALTS